MTAEDDFPDWVLSALSGTGNRFSSPDSDCQSRGLDLGYPSTAPWSDALILREHELPCIIESTYTREESEPLRDPYTAGFTCDKCPQPMRPYEQLAGSTTSFLAWDWSTLSFVECEEWVPFNPPVYETRYTERCTTCATRMKRWLRAQRDLEDIHTVSAFAPNTPLVAFVTLTMPNLLIVDGCDRCRQDAVRAFKRQVATWRRTSGVKTHVHGGFDYYEQTETIYRASELESKELRESLTEPLARCPHRDTSTLGSRSSSTSRRLQDSASGIDLDSQSSILSLNTHHHGVWVMSSRWPQAAMQDSWRRGIVHIKKIRNVRSALRYVTKYATKQNMDGVRTRERWGSCRGSALSAIRESMSAQGTESFAVDDASD